MPTPRTDPAGTDLRDALATLRVRCDELGELQTEQSAAVAAGDFARVAAVAARREGILTSLAGAASPRSLHENWDARVATLAPDERAAAEADLAAVEAALADLLARHERDLAAAVAARDRTASELAAVRASGGVHAAYRDHLGQRSSRRLELEG